MIIDEMSEFRELVKALEVLDEANTDIVIDINRITIIKKSIVSVGNVDYKFQIIMDSDGIENLIGNSKRIKVT